MPGKGTGEHQEKEDDVRKLEEALRAAQVELAALRRALQPVPEWKPFPYLKPPDLQNLYAASKYHRDFVRKQLVADGMGKWIVAQSVAEKFVLLGNPCSESQER